MRPTRLTRLLGEVARGETSPEEAAARLADLPFQEVAGDGGEVFARADRHRELRRGFPEAVLAPGKTPAQIAAIARSLVADGSTVLVTRVEDGQADALRGELPAARWEATARMLVVGSSAPDPLGAGVGVVSAGTSDAPVAEEAAVTAEAMGAEVHRVYDVGVAGLHRLLAHVPLLRSLHALVVVAGMEAALASVVAGLVPCPVVAVPTSTGYGASFDGVAALLSLLNACSPGVTVVNIGNGFGAGYAAVLAVAQARRLGAASSASGERDPSPGGEDS